MVQAIRDQWAIVASVVVVIVLAIALWSARRGSKRP